MDTTLVDLIKTAGKALTWVVLAASFLFSLKGDLRVMDAKLDGINMRVGRLESYIDSLHGN